MCIDLLKLIIFADGSGKLHKKQQRRLFSIVDGVIGGENNGPLNADPIESGVLLAGDNFLAVDIVGSRLMGFDPKKIKMFDYALGDKDWD